MANYYIPPEPDDEYDWMDIPYTAQPGPLTDQPVRSRRDAPYSDFLTEGMRYGLTREEIQRAVPEAGYIGFEEGIAQLEERYARGYSQHVQQMQQLTQQRRQEARSQGMGWKAAERIDFPPVSPAQWRNYPEHLRERRLQGQPIQTNEYGGMDIPEGHMARKGGKFSFPIDVMQSSWLGQKAGGYVSTFAEGKLMKRVQSLLAHETVGLSNRPSVQAPFKSGPGATQADWFTPMRGALVLGGDPGPAGQGYLDPRVGSMTRTTSMDVRGKGIGEPVAPGTTFARGEHIRLASGTAGWRSREWGYRVKDVAPIDEGYRFTLEQSAPITQAAIAGKAGSTKVLWAPRDLSGVTDVRGKSLGLDFMAGLKDVQGAAMERFQAEWMGASGQQRERIAKELGFGSASQMPGSFAEMGPQVLKRMATQAGSVVQQIHVPEVLHREALPRYAATTISKQPWVNPATGQVDPNRFQTTQRYEAITGNFLKQLMKEYDTGRVTVGPEDLQAMQRARPELAARLEQEGAPLRQAYQHALQAAGVSGGSPRQMAEAPISAKDPGFRRALLEAGAQARHLAQEEAGLKPNEDIEESLIARKFVEQMGQSAYGGRFVEWGEGYTQMPFQSMRQFAAQGVLKGQEASRLLKSSWGMARTLANQEEGKFGYFRGQYMESQREIAESKHGRRRAEGVTLDPGRARGYKGLGHGGLGINEAYIPGMEPGAAMQIFGFPSHGEETWDPRMQVQQIDPMLAASMGMSLDRPYVSEDIAQALSRDFDADIFYAMASGEVTWRRGKFYDQEGNQLDPGVVKQMGAKRIAQGAGELSKEHAGYEQMLAEGRMGPARAGEALRSAQETLAGIAREPVELSGAAIQGQVTEGNRLYEAIGPGYQAMRQLFSRARDKLSMGGVRDIWNEIYGYAQRPAKPPEDYQRVLDLATASARGGVYQRYKGMMGRMGSYKGIQGLQYGLSEVLAGRVKSGSLSASRAASILAPTRSPERGIIAESLRQYRSGGINFGQLMYGEQGGIGTVMSPERFALESPGGQFLGAKLVGKTIAEAKREGRNVKAATAGLGISMESVGTLAGINAQMQAQTTSLRKKGISVEEYFQSLETSGRGVPFDIPQVPQPSKWEQMGAAQAARGARTFPAGAPVESDWFQAMSAAQQARGARVFRTEQAAAQPPASLAQQALAQIGGMGALRQSAADITAYKQQHGRSAVPPVDMRLTRQAVNWMSQQGGVTPQDYEEWGQIAGQVGIGFGKGSGAAQYYHSYTGLYDAAQQPAPAGPKPGGIVSQAYYDWAASTLGQSGQLGAGDMIRAAEQAAIQGLPQGAASGWSRVGAQPGPAQQLQANRAARAAGQQVPYGRTPSGPAQPPSTPTPPGGGGQQPPQNPFPPGPAMPAQPPGPSGPTNPPYNPQRPWDTPSGAWISQAQFDELAEAKNQLGQWGEKVAEAIKGTDEFNKEQRSLVKEFLGYEKSINRMGKTIDQMENEVAKAEEIYGAENVEKWAGKMRGRAQAGRRAIGELLGTPGFAEMGGEWGQEGAAPRMRRIDRERLIAEATGAGGAGGQPPGMLGRIQDWLGGGGKGSSKFADYGVMGLAAGGLHRFTSGWELMRLQRLWNLTGAPTFNQYIPAAAQAEMAGWQASMAIGGYSGGLPGGIAGGVMQYQAAQRRADINAGRTGYAAWGWMQQSAGGLKELQAMFGPAAGIGLIGGGLATSAGVAAGAPAAAAATTLGLPLTLGLGGIATLGAIGAYSMNVSDQNAENAMAMLRASQAVNPGGFFAGGGADWGARFRLGATGLGMDVRDLLETGQMSGSSMRQMGVTAARILNRPMGQLSGQERAAGLTYLAEELQGMEGTIWQGMGPEQIQQVLQQVAPYQDLMGMGIGELVNMTGGGTSLMQQVGGTGRAPGEYAGLASQLGGGATLAARLFSQGVGMSQAQEQSWMSAIGQRAGMMRFGYGAEEIIQSINRGTRAATPQDVMGMPGQQIQEGGWREKLSEEQQVAWGMGQSAAASFAQAYGLAPAARETQQFLERMEKLSIENAQVEISNAQLAVQVGGQVAQYTGAGATQTQAYFEQLANAGVSPAAMGIIGQQMMGQGAVSGALGIAPGFGTEQRLQGMLASGEITPQQYQQMAGMAQFGAGKLGYSMMAGNWGAGAALRQFRESQGVPLIEGATPLMEPVYGEGGEITGIYNRNQLAIRRKQEEMAQMQYERQMGTGAWATQTTTAGPWGGGLTFQMGIAGDIEQQQLDMQSWQAQRGIRNQMFEQQAQQQRDNSAYQMQMLETRYRQQMESMGLQRRMWETQTGFQRQQFGVQWQQMQQQQAWGREDMAFNRQQAGMQYGWQMEDLERDIRFATGRQKQGLLRQRERAEEMYSVQEGRRGVQEDRQEQLWKQEEEQFARKRANFEEMKALETEQYEMQKRHAAELFALQMAHLQEQAEAAEKNIELQRQLRDLQDEQTERHNEKRLADLQQQQAFQEASHAKQLEINALQKENEDAYATFLADQAAAMNPGGIVYEAWAALAGLASGKEVTPEKKGRHPKAKVGEEGKEGAVDDLFTEMADQAEAALESLRDAAPLREEAAKLDKDTREAHVAYLQDIDTWQSTFFDQRMKPALKDIFQAQGELSDQTMSWIDEQKNAMSPGGTLWESWNHMIDTIATWLRENFSLEGTEEMQHGGAVEEGRPYIVGERGPELFVPGTYGSIVPNSQLGATTVSVGNITIQVTGTGDPEAVANAVFAKFEQQTNALAKRQGRRGQVWQ